MNSDKFPTSTSESDRTEYQNHPVFKDLEGHISFYDSFSMSIMGFITLGTKAVMNIDSYVYSSMKGTLESIKLVLSDGKIGDAYALLRKLHDSVILNVYTNLYLETNHSLEKNFLVQEVIDWMNGRKKLPHNTYGSMSEYLENSNQLKEVYSVLYADKKYSEMRARCNDHIHFNSFDNILINDNQVYSKKRMPLLDSFRNDLEKVFILHLALIFTLNDHYMISSDYTDCLDVGMDPEPDSQYWVAPYIQDAFTKIVENKRPDIAKYIKRRSSMHLR